MKQTLEDRIANRKKLGAKLQFIRKELGFTQEYVASLIQQDRKNISHWETGVYQAPVQYIQFLAALGHYDPLSVLDPAQALQAAKYIPVDEEDLRFIRRYKSATPRIRDIVNKVLELKEVPTK